MSVFDQIFIRQEYSCLQELTEPSLVLDLGANVGFSAAYFLSVFPRARVVAVEPDAGNVAICRANLSPYGDRVLLLHGAAWSRPATLRLLKGTFGDGREWSYQVDELIEEERTSVGVQGWDVGSLGWVNPCLSAGGNLVAIGVGAVAPERGTRSRGSVSCD